MYKDVGGKIQGLAKLVCIFGIFVVLIAGVFSIRSSAGYLALPAILSMAFGCFAIWVSSLTIYGFGQLIQENEKQRELLEQQNKLLEQLSSAVFYGFSQMMEDKPK